MPKPTIRQHAPYAIQIELCEGCNLRCSFCGLNGIRGKEHNFKFLTVENASTICNRIIEAEWTPRIEFAMHGEPSQNPNMLRILRLFRRVLGDRYHLMMTSNGAGFIKEPTETVDQALESLNVLALDAYENVNIVPKILERYNGVHKPLFYPYNKDANPHKRRKQDEHDLVIVQDISEATVGTHSTLNNHAGSGAPKDYSANGKRCAKPFRELSIRWDGNVAICCNDWPGRYKCGNVLDTPLEAIWQGPAFAAARLKLYHGQRDFGPCHGCNALSYRPGLLPDPQGKETLPMPDKATQAAIDKALAGKPYTAPVLRQWELEQIDG